MEETTAILDPDEFSQYVYDVKSPEGSYVDALRQAVEDFDLEEETVPDLMTARLKMVVTQEAEELRLIRREGESLPLDL